MKILKLEMCLAVFISSVVSVRAVQLGQTMEELVAEFGPTHVGRSRQANSPISLAPLETRRPI